MEAINLLNSIFAGGNVKRHHNYPIIDRQSVAEHTWRVMALYDQIFGPVREIETLRKILYHDVAEYKTGDIPANAKWRSPVLSEELFRLQMEDEQALGIDVTVGDIVFQKIKFCDRVEHMMFCLEQRRLGNRNVARPFYKLVEFVKQNMKEILQDHRQACNLFYQILAEYKGQERSGDYVGAQEG